MVAEVRVCKMGWEIRDPTFAYENKMRCIYFMEQFEFIIGC